MGIGVLTLPFYISQMGLIIGVIAIILGGILSYMKFIFIFEMSDRH